MALKDDILRILKAIEKGKIVFLYKVEQVPMPILMAKLDNPPLEDMKKAIQELIDEGKILYSENEDTARLNMLMTFGITVKGKPTKDMLFAHSFIKTNTKE